MSFGTLALICLCGLAGPLLSSAGGGAIPVVVGELAVGVLIGRTGFQAIDPGNTTLNFLYEIGFAMLMFVAGMSVPLREPGLAQSIGRGARAAALVALLAVGAGVLALPACRRGARRRLRGTCRLGLGCDRSSDTPRTGARRFRRSDRDGAGDRR